MQINEKTMNVLKNFSSINPSIVVKEGNVLSTISPGKTILAKATVPDTFPRKFALYLVNKLINTMSVYENPSVEFNEKDFTITGSGTTDVTVLTYGDESAIKTPPEKPINLPSVDASCKITNEQLVKITRFLGVLGVGDIGIIGDGNKVLLRAFDSANNTSDHHDIEIGVTDKSFSAIFKSENIKIVPGDYEVSISSKGISHFKGVDIEYWIAVESNSTF
jgi:hypothetical protein